MKKLLIIGIFSFMLMNANYASNADLFNYNKENIEARFAQLNTLENYVSTYDYTLSDLKANNTFILTELHLNNIESSRPLGMMFEMDDMDWKSFAWGFCCWPIGIFTVLLDDDKGSDSKISFFIGWGVSAVLSAISTRSVYSSF